MTLVGKSAFSETSWWQADLSAEVRRATPAEASQPNQPFPAKGGPAEKKSPKVSRIQQSFLQAWKPNKSESRHLRETTNYSSD